MLTYEHTSPHTPFGQQMVQNLNSRGCPLLSLSNYPCLESQLARYKAQGWSDAAGATMLQTYDGFPEDERKRASKLEWLDELEEWNLLLSHYFILIATKGEGVLPGQFGLAALA
jgi:tRNA wybutosine-synthesizing protein 4